MRVLIVGVGDAFTEQGFGSCALIEAPEGPLLVDCPDLIHRALRDATRVASWKVKSSEIHDILLTHLHGDHCNGLESFGFARMLQRLEGASAPLPRLHLSRPAAERVWERLAPAMDCLSFLDRPARLDDFFEVHVIEPEREVRVAGLSVHSRFTRHSIPTTGFLISDGRSTLGWSADTAFDSSHIAWLSGADLIVHESNRGSVHTPVEKLNSLPSKIRDKMRLIHLPDDFQPDTTDIQRLRPGDLLEL